MIKKYTLHDNAMAPEYPCGAIVLAREINPELFIEWGEAYLLETENGAILTRLAPSEDKARLVCVRDNEKHYHAFEIPKAAVRGFYRVIACAKYM